MSGDSAPAGHSGPAEGPGAAGSAGLPGGRGAAKDAGPAGDAAGAGDATTAGAPATAGAPGPAGGPEQADWDVPWAESPVTGTGAPGRAELEVVFAAAMRQTGALMQLLGQAAADRIGINATDLNCLNILSFQGHMSAGELATATGLTTASITGVIDRLEEAGYVTRERDPHDRRRVVVTMVRDRAMRDVASVFAPVLRDWREMAAQYSDDELRLIVDYYARMAEILRAHLNRLRDRNPAGG